MPKWNSSKAPEYLVHFSDAHVNNKQPLYGSHLHNAFKAAAGYSPEVLLNTGDMVDDYDKAAAPKYGHQTEMDWKLYYEMALEFNGSFGEIIEIPGNHDMFGVRSIDSPNFHYLGYTMFGRKLKLETEDDLRLIRYSSGGFDFVFVNPYSFPTVHPPLMFYVTPNKGLLDRLEAAIENTDDNSTLIVASHYPASMFTKSRSSSGKTYKEIVASEKVAIYLSGHYHGNHPKFEHHGDSLLEVIAEDIKGDKEFGIVTFDNGRVCFHRVDPERPPNALITYPIPLEQITSKSGFNDKDAVVRLLVFGDGNESITCVCGNYSEKMRNVMEVKPNVFVFECGVLQNLNFGSIYYMEFTGDFVGNITFCLGDVYNKVTVEEVNSLYEQVIVGMFAVGIGMSFMVLVTFPINVFRFSKFNNWIASKDYEHGAGYWVLAVFAGFLGVRGRIANHPMWLRLLLFFVAIYPLVFPLAFLETEGVVGILWLYGYVIDGKARYAEWGQVYTALYYACVVFPAVLVASGLGMPGKIRWTIVADIATGVIGIAGTVKVIHDILMTSVGPVCASLSPAFVLIPILLIISLMITACTRKPVPKAWNPDPYGQLNEVPLIPTH